MAFHSFCYAGNINPELPEKIDSIQNPEAIDNERSNLWLLISRIEEQLDLRLKDTDNHDFINYFLTEDCEIKNPGVQEAKALYSESDLKEHDYGLSLRGQYTKDTITSADDDETRSYMELSWDILKGGYRDNKSQARTLEQKANLTKYQGEINQQIRISKCNNYHLSQLFSGLKSRLLTLKAELMNAVYKIERRAYFKGWSYLDDYLIAESEIELVRNELKFLHSSSSFDESIVNIVNPPVIGVNIDEITNAMRGDDRFDNVTSMEKNILNHEENTLQRNSLRLFLRHELDIGSSGSEPSDLVTGLRFTVPLGKRSKAPLHYKLQHLDEEGEYNKWERLARVRTAYAKMAEQTSRVIKQQYRYVHANERLRRSIVEKHLDSDTDIAVAVIRLRESLNTSLELLNEKEELYRRVNAVFLSAHLNYRPEFLYTVNLPDTDYRARIGNRSVYLWSPTFNAISNETIMDFLEAKGIKRIALSAGSKVDRHKMLDFIEQTKNDNLSVELIVGANEWVFPENHERAAILTATAAEHTGMIHLDIEPHTLPDYKENQEEYHRNYLKLLESVNTAIDDNKLSVSIPVHWPAEVYQEIEKLVDTIYIMAYGKKNIDALENSLAVSSEMIPDEKYVIALRVNDFEDEWELENIFEMLNKRMNINQFSLHKFGDYFNKAGNIQ